MPETQKQFVGLGELHSHLLAGGSALRKGRYCSLCFETGKGSLADAAESLVSISAGITDRAIIAHIALACPLGRHRSSMP